MTAHRSIVSLTATITALALGACVQRPSPPPGGDPTPVESYPLAIDFDNGTREHVHVYLTADRREWLLGRLEPGTRASLRIPAGSLAGSTAFVHLTVLTGERLTPHASHHSRATFSVPQPVSAILSQRWMFAQGQLTPIQLEAGSLEADRQ
jgi:hypothetical protein